VKFPALRQLLLVIQIMRVSADTMRLQSTIAIEQPTLVLVDAPTLGFARSVRQPAEAMEKSDARNRSWLV
jgi:hypothetical protein